jgi:chromosome segregation ATPase
MREELQQKEAELTGVDNELRVYRDTIRRADRIHALEVELARERASTSPESIQQAREGITRLEPVSASLKARRDDLKRLIDAETQRQREISEAKASADRLKQYANQTDCDIRQRIGKLEDKFQDLGHRSQCLPMCSSSQAEYNEISREWTAATDERKILSKVLSTRKEVATLQEEIDALDSEIKELYAPNNQDRFAEIPPLNKAVYAKRMQLRLLQEGY